MTEIIEGITIGTFIKKQIKALSVSDEIKKTITDLNARMQVIIDEKKKHIPDISFYNAFRLYAFGLCLVNQIMKQKTVEPYLELFFKINKYLYRGQYYEEQSYTYHTPDTKIVINNILAGKPVDIPVREKISNELPEKITIPKLNENILTEPKLLKTTGLMNSDITKLIGDSKFFNVDTLPLEPYRLKNQFRIAFRKSKIIPLIHSTNDNIDDIAMDLCSNLFNEKNELLINRYYLFHFNINSKTNKIIPLLLLNSICDVNFNRRYLYTLKKKLYSETDKERYIFTFGVFSGFKRGLGSVLSDMLVGFKHRCALIFDKHEKKIYLYDTFLEECSEIYLFDDTPNKQNLYNSIIIACNYTFKNIDFLKDYTFYLKDIPMQKHDVMYKNIITASVYYRYYNNKEKYLDWSGGYCGTHVLLLLVLMSLNPYVELKEILNFLYIISKSEIKNYQLLILLIRSFAYQIENIMYGREKEVQIQEFDIVSYLKSNGNIIKLNDTEINLQRSDIPENIMFNILEPSTTISELNRVKREKFKRIIIPEENEPKIIQNESNIMKTQLATVYLGSTQLLFNVIANIFRKINKLEIQLTPEQRLWKLENYGPDDTIAFIKV